MRRFTGFLAGILVSAVSAAQSSDVPVSNWTVPPYAQSANGGLTTMTDATPPRVFIGVLPCRIVDTRAGSGFLGSFGPPGLAPAVARSFDLNDGPCPGLPFDLSAYSLNITVVSPAGPGHLIVYPAGGTQPSVSSINFGAGQTIANAVIVPAGAGGAITVVAGVSATDVLIDINGYFSQSPGNFAASLILLNSNSGAPTAEFFNSSSACGLSSCAIRATSHTNTSGKAAAGIVPFSGGNSAGVFGSQGIGTTNGTFAVAPSYSGAGVLGHSPNNGVLGISTFQGVVGGVISGSTELAYGILGFRPGATYGVFSGGAFGGTGAKYFVEPHPTDASKVIRYIALEGPEAGTYIRGRGKFERGLARIRVPEDFRLVTDEEGLTVQITPIGPMATFSVLRADLREIVVQASRNVEFYYLVQGVRRTHKHLTSPIAEGGEYLPRSPDARIPAYLTEGQKEFLIRNGTYKPDGTVNMETAHRLGWDRVWAEREQPRAEPTP